MRALADACAATMAELGHERFHAAGNSLGGGVALHLALDGRALVGVRPVPHRLHRRLGPGLAAVRSCDCTAQAGLAERGA